MFAGSIILYIIYLILPILAIYVGYLIVTKAFNDMGFTSFEAIIIVFISFLVGNGMFNVGGFEFDSIFLFHHGNWEVRINTGGAIIPLILSIYLSYKNKFDIKKIIIGISIVAIVTYFVTYPEPQKGIISSFPFWLLPVIFASFTSIFLFWKNKVKAAPFAYIAGTIGVLIGADLFHLIELLSFDIQKETPAIIGGAVVFDMVFITGILAVVVDGILIYQEKLKSK